MSSRSSSLLGAFAGATLFLLSGCGGGEDTGTTCPTGGTTLTYQNFGQTFMGTYCLRCHNEALSGAARHDAPSDVNFNTVEQIRAEADEIDKQAGAGTTVTNDSMPPKDSAEKPSVEERRKLSEWLACGAP